MSNSRGIGINEQNVSVSGAFFSCYTEVYNIVRIITVNK